MKLINVSRYELAKKLQIYLKADSLYKVRYVYAKKRFEVATHLTAHNWGHAYRDTINAIVIGEAEGADMSIVLPAATLNKCRWLRVP